MARLSGISRVSEKNLANGMGGMVDQAMFATCLSNDRRTPPHNRGHRVIAKDNVSRSDDVGWYHEEGPTTNADPIKNINAVSPCYQDLWQEETPAL